MREYLSVLVTLSPDDRAALECGSIARAYDSAWSAVTAFLTREIGSWFDSFYPSPTPWGIPVPPGLYGTILGQVEPEKFKMLYLLAGTRQENIAEQHKRDLLHAVLGTDDLSDLPSIMTRFVQMDSGSETGMHLAWLDEFGEGKLVPGGSLYYLARGRYEVRKSVVEEILAAPERYALCTVEIYAETPKFQPRTIRLSPELRESAEKSNTLRDFKRFMRGDWGESSREEQERNDAAVAAGSGLIRAEYRSGAVRYVIRTSEDQTSAELLLLEEEPDEGNV